MIGQRSSSSAKCENTREKKHHTNEEREKSEWNLFLNIEEIINKNSSEKKN